MFKKVVMTAKEKAEGLVKMFLEETNLFTGNNERHSNTHVKRCALIYCNEQIKTLSKIKDGLMSMFLIKSAEVVGREIDEIDQIKQHIQNPISHE
jgi:hypothetical protein